MNQKPTQWISLGLCMLGLAVSAALFTHLPDKIPTHFDVAGNPDQWSDRFPGAVMVPLIMFAIWGMLWILPRISPKGWRVEPFMPVWNRIQLAILAFLLLVHVGILGHAVGWWGANLSRLIVGGIGLLFLFLGNYLGKTTRNFFLGIRTPWTLASDEVWRRTHRLGGRVMVAAGAVMVLMALVGVHQGVLVAVIILAALVPVVYSFFAYRSLEGFNSSPPE
ncbi:MAG: SdpI family protein [Gammaproteobacteria bacterium]